MRISVLSSKTKSAKEAVFCGNFHIIWILWVHEKDLEEVYCYFDMPLPKFGFHISYLKSGEVEDIVTHTVHSGTMVQAPCGYHPTVASPGSRNAYLWVLAAFRPESRRYDLAINDRGFDK